MSYIAFISELKLYEATIRGVDLRDNSEFEGIFRINDDSYAGSGTEHIRKYIVGEFGIRGFHVKDIQLSPPTVIQTDLQEVYKKLLEDFRAKQCTTPPAGAAGNPLQEGAPEENGVGRDDPGALTGAAAAENAGELLQPPAGGSSLQERDEEPPFDLGPEPPSRRKGTSLRLYEYIRQHPEPGVLKSISNATAARLTVDDIRNMINGDSNSGHRWKIIGTALDLLEQRPTPPPGEADIAKLRRRVQKALINYSEKHGKDNLLPIVRATAKRVTEDTINKMICGDETPLEKHLLAVDKALRKMDIENT